MATHEVQVVRQHSAALRAPRARRRLPDRGHDRHRHGPVHLDGLPQHVRDEEFVGRLRASVAPERARPAGGPGRSQRPRPPAPGPGADLRHGPGAAADTRRRHSSAPTGSASTPSGRCGPRTSPRGSTTGTCLAGHAAAVQTQLTRDILTYQDHVASLVAETYTRDHEALNRSRAHVRRSLVRDDPAGEGGTLTASDLAVLAYPLDAHHIAVLLPRTAEGAATRLADALRGHAQRVPVADLPAHAGQHRRVAGPARPVASGRPAVARRRRWTRSAPTASVSNPGAGVDGFAAALRQAEDAERVRARVGRPRARPPSSATPTRASRSCCSRTRSSPGPSSGRARARWPARTPRRAGCARPSRRRSGSAATSPRPSTSSSTSTPSATGCTRPRRCWAASPQERRTELQVAVRLVRLLGAPTDRAGARPNRARKSAEQVRELPGCSYAVAWAAARARPRGRRAGARPSHSVAARNGGASSLPHATSVGARDRADQAGGVGDGERLAGARVPLGVGLQQQRAHGGDLLGRRPRGRPAENHSDSIGSATARQALRPARRPARSRHIDRICVAGRRRPCRRAPAGRRGRATARRAPAPPGRRATRRRGAPGPASATSASTASA